MGFREPFVAAARAETDIVPLFCKKKALWMISGLVPAFHRSGLTLHPSPAHGCQRANCPPQAYNGPVLTAVSAAKGTFLTGIKPANIKAISKSKPP